MSERGKEVKDDGVEVVGGGCRNEYPTLTPHTSYASDWKSAV